ncbi:MAG: PAS domain S-box protein, partial [Lentimicrobium sp.]|nr:PAS domain S-box protein [Lentimicrobium sp.]
MKDKANSSQANILRQKAEEQLKNKSIPTDKNISDIETLKLIHELDVHQVELEMQNEELLTAKIKAETDAEKYTNLYDFAPSGYFTLSKEGEIMELNFRGATLLGKERSFLLNKRFEIFVSDKTRPKFNLFLEEIFNSKTKQTCEINLAIVPNNPTYVYLSGIVNDDDEQCLVTMLDISQIKKAEKETRINIEKYRTLFETNRDSITIFRIESDGNLGKFIETNKATTTLFGYTKEEILTLNIKDIEIVSDKKLKKRIETFLSKGSISFETIIKNKKGNQRNVEVEATLINYLDEPAVMNITRDITEQKQLQNNIKNANESLTTILEAIPDLLFEVNLEGRIFHYQAHREDLLASDPSAFMGNLFQNVIPANAANICIEAILEASNKGWSTGKQYSLDLPQGKHWFELSVSPIKETENTEQHFILLARDITDRKIADEKLRIEKERIRTILELVGNPIFLKDNDHKITYANTAFFNLFGLNKKNVIGKTLAENVPENEKEHFLKIDRKVLDTGIPDIREEELTVNGVVHTIITSKTRFIDESGNKSLIGSIYDITERKKAEEALQKSQEKLRGVFDLANSGIILTDLKGKYLLFNNWCTEAFGYTREEMNRLTRDEITHPDDLENSNLIFNKLVSGEIDRCQIEKRFIRKDKSFFWAEVSVSAIKDKNNKVVNTIGIINDITEQRNAKIALQESEARLIETQELAKVGSWETDFAFTNIVCSKEISRIFGIDPETTKITLEKFLAIVHPEDRLLVETTFVHSIKKHTLNKFEHRIITAKGIEKTVEEHWEILRDEEGKPLQAVGTCQDITERKQVEEKLVANEHFLYQTQIIANLGSYSLDFTTGKWTSTAILDHIFGIDANFERTVEGWTSIIHPEWQTIMSDYLKNEVIGKKNNFNKEYKIIKIDSKEERWLHGMGEVTFNEEGQPLQLIGSIQDITERKLVEEKLRESEEKYRGLVENSPDGIVIYVNDKITFVNDEALRIIKAKNREEIIGKPVLKYIHPDSKESIIQKMKEVIMDNHSSKIVEEKFISLEGEAIYVELKAIPTTYENQNAVQVIIHDITERKRTQEKIKQLSQAVEQSPVAIIITNISGEIEYANPKFTETTGYSLDEILGQNSRFLKSGHTSVNEYKQLWQTLISGNEWFGEFHNKRKDGSLYWESASISPILDAQGKTTHFIAIKEDITERKHIEQQLVKAKEKAEESDRLKLAFLANMSHEIRTPMNGILGFTELLKEPKLSGEEQQEYINIIEKSGKRMLNIINDIISISKVESGQIEVSLSETNVNEQIEYIQTFFKPEAKQKGIQLIISKQLSPIDTLIKTDREKIYAILTNLVKNALKFTNEGSIDLGCVKKEKNLEFYVKDTGLGISTSQKKIIFERFRQANETISRTHEGSGLGLAISKAYVEMLGGKIWVESEQGKGSAFYFTIPFNSEYKPKEKTIAEKVKSEAKEE